ncbi:MAG: S-methyl-5'-thioadenosine phosphorylase [Phycisphaera sp.]|nr:S-methyl-5'-thioadenosine phosphorylase [Phycisphaera sp.]
MSQAPIKVGIIGGSGVEEALGVEDGEHVTVDTPFGPAASPITLAKWHKTDVAILKRHGPGHVFNPSQVPYRANIFALKKLGVTHVIATGATGSLREQVHPGQLVIPDQVIDKTHKREQTFFDHAAVHVEMAEPFCPVVRRWLIESANKIDGAKVHAKGTYVCMEGPAFSTKAESLMHRAWGGDVIGMTCMPEAKLAKEAEIAYALVVLPTDYDCWKPHQEGVSQQDLLSEIIGNLRMATTRGIELVKAALEDTSILRKNPSPSHTALKLGIWSDKSKIDRKEVERLDVLWGRYF